MEILFRYSFIKLIDNVNWHCEERGNVELYPAIRFNLFFFKEKKKRISATIWAREFRRRN